MDVAMWTWYVQGSENENGIVFGGGWVWSIVNLTFVDGLLWMALLWT